MLRVRQMLDRISPLREMDADDLPQDAWLEALRKLDPRLHRKNSVLVGNERGDQTAMIFAA